MDNELDQAIARVLRGKQAENVVSNGTIIDATGIPERTLIRYLKGQRAIPLAKMIAIAEAIGADPGEVVKTAVESVKVAEKQRGVDAQK